MTALAAGRPAATNVPSVTLLRRATVGTRSVRSYASARTRSTAPPRVGLVPARPTCDALGARRTIARRRETQQESPQPVPRRAVPRPRGQVGRGARAHPRRAAPGRVGARARAPVEPPDPRSVRLAHGARDAREHRARGQRRDRLPRPGRHRERSEQRRGTGGPRKGRRHRPRRAAEAGRRPGHRRARLRRHARPDVPRPAGPKRRTSCRRPWTGSSREAGEDPTRMQAARQLSATITSYVKEFSVPIVEIARDRPKVAASALAIKENRLRTDGIGIRLDQFLAQERARASKTAASAQDEAERAIALGPRRHRRLGAHDPADRHLPHAVDRAAGAAGRLRGQPDRARRAHGRPRRARPGRDRDPEARLPRDGHGPRRAPPRAGGAERAPARERAPEVRAGQHRLARDPHTAGEHPRLHLGLAPARGLARPTGGASSRSSARRRAG